MEAHAETEEIRARIAEAVRSGQAEAVVPFLRHTLAIVRSEAMDALAALQKFDPIVEGLRDLEPTLRTKAVSHLAQARDGNADFRLVQALRHVDPEVRAAAFDYAVERRSPRLLLIALDDRDVRRRRAALDLFVKERLPGFLEAMARAGDEPAVPTREIVGLLGGAEGKSARTLLKKRREEAIPLLIERGPEDEHAIDLLFELAPEKAAGIVRDRWAELAPAVRARAIDRLTLDEATLRAAADEPHEVVRFTALRHLLKRNLEMPDERWIEAIRKAAPGQWGWTEGDLVRVIRKARGADGVRALATIARGTFPYMRRAAAETLRKAEAVEELAALADVDDPWVVKEAALALGERVDPRAVFPLVRTSRECRGARRAAELLEKYPEVKTFEFALAALRHSRGSVRLYGAERLEGVEDARAVEPLAALLDDPSAEIQFAAVRALAKFAKEERVWRRLLKCLELGDLSVRQAAVEILGEGRIAAAVPALIPYLGNRFLKRYVAAALKNIGDRKGYLAVLRRKRRDDEVEHQRELIRKRNTHG